MRAILALAALVTLAPGMRAGNAVLITAEGRQIAVRRFHLDADPARPLTLNYEDAQGASVQVGCDALDEIRIGDSSSEPEPGPALAEVDLWSGDRYVGMLSDGGTPDQSFRLRTAFTGEIEFQLPQVKTIRSRGNGRLAPLLPEKLEADLVIKTSGEKGEGYLRAIDARQVTYHSTLLGRDVSVPHSDFVVAYLMPTQAVPKVPSVLYVLITGRDGSSAQGALRELKDDGLAFTDLFGVERRLALGQVGSIFFKNGRVLYLSDLAPSAVDENANYIRDEKPMPGDLVIPWQIDRNARGGPLSIRQKTYRKGLGVHAYSSLMYTLEGSFDKFHATLGIDDCAAGRGHVLFQVFVDDSKKLERARSGEEAPIEVTVPISGARTLRLVVDFGDYAGVGDYADWASARIVK